MADAISSRVEALARGESGGSGAGATVALCGMGLGLILIAFYGLQAHHATFVTDVWRWFHFGAVFAVDYLVPDGLARASGYDRLVWGGLFPEGAGMGWVADYLSSEVFWRRRVDPVAFEAAFWGVHGPLLALSTGWVVYRTFRDGGQGATRYDAPGLLAANAPWRDHLGEFGGRSLETEPLAFRNADGTFNPEAASLSAYEFCRLSPPMGTAKDADPALRAAIYDEGRGEEFAFDTAQAERVLAAQLGGRWTGSPECLSATETLVFERLRASLKGGEGECAAYLEGCFAALAARPVWACAPDADYESLVGARRVSPCERPWAALAVREAAALEAALDADGFAGLSERLAADGANASLVQGLTAERIMGRHGFIRPGLMSLLDEVRSGMVMPVHEFRRFLKKDDRPLWYALQCVGRRVAYPEACGVYAHWQVERLVEVPIPEPEVLAGVRGLRETLVKRLA